MARQNRRTTRKNRVVKEKKDKKPTIKFPKNIDDHTITEVGQKVKILNDISTVNGTLYKGEIVKVETSINMGKNNLKVIDNLGRFWFINSKDITTKI